ncbi:MAG: DNA-3-methyladenine glycosylase [Myxococcota bacterium]
MPATFRPPMPSRGTGRQRRRGATAIGLPDRLEALTPEFYERPILRVARALLGCLLIRDFAGRRLAGRIVEVEAYGGLVDPASHSFRGLTPRCRSMFGPRGHSYVYRIYGIHHCMNIAAGNSRLAGAILLRAVEPIEGLASMRKRRSGRGDLELCRGPGRLCAAYGLDLSCDGIPLSQPSGLWIAASPPLRGVRWTPRIGLGANPSAPWLWRCVAPNSKYATPTPRRWPSAPRPQPALPRARIR